MPLLSRNHGLIGLTLWAALLLSSPYMIGMRPFGGSASFSLMYPLVAATMLAGMWLAAHPAVASHNDRAARTAVLIGTLATASLIIPEWLDLGLMGTGSNLESAVSLTAAQGFRIPQALYAFSSALSIPFAIIAALSCGIFAQLTSFQPAAESNSDGGDANPACQSLLTPRPRAAIAMFVMIGLLQPIAWTIWLPHGPFPLAPAASDVPYSSLAWTTIAPMALVPLLEQVIACKCALGASKCPTCTGFIEQLQHARLAHPSLAALLIGTTVGSVLVGAFPGLRAVSQSEALIFAGAQIILIVALPIAIKLADRQKHLRKQPACRRDDTSPEPTDVSAPYIQALLELGLTNREASAVAGHLMGLSSAQIATQLGIKASSVREYGRRACKRLGLSSLSEFKILAGKQEPTPAASNHGAVGSRRGIQTKAIAQIMSMASLAAALLPISTGYMTHGKALATVVGVLLGLMGIWLAKGRSAQNKRKGMESGPVCIALACAALLCICSLVLRASNLPMQWGYGALMLCTAALTATGLAQFDCRAVTPHAPCATFVLGWSWASSWLAFLDMNPLSSWVAIPPLLILAVMLCLIVGRADSHHLLVILTAIVSVAFGFLTSPASALLLLTTTLTLFIGENDLGENPLAASRLQASTVKPIPALAMLGIVVALVPLGIKSWLEVVASPRLADGVYSTVAIVVGSITALALLADCWEIMAHLRGNQELAREILPSDLQRMEGFLVSRGLSPRQVSVAVRTAQGASLGEIGNELNLSKTAVHVSRHEAFSMLGVHSTHELVNLLRNAIR